MSRRRPSRISDRVPVVACLFVASLVVFADLPADATGPACFSRSLFIRAAGPSGESGETGSTAAALAAPVHLRARRENGERNNGWGGGPIALAGIRATGVTDVSRRATSARPTVTIITPADQATVPASTLRVRGIVNAHGAKVRVVVNGVRASVREGTFTAGVSVSANTVLLTAVATTADGASARHQIGLTVSGTVESDLRLRPFPAKDVPPKHVGFSLRSAPIPFARRGNVDHDVESASTMSCSEDQSVDSPPVDHYPTPATTATGSTEAATTTHIPGPVAAADHLPWKSRSLTVEPRRATAGRTVEVLFVHSGEGSRAESALLTQHGFLTQIAADMASLRLAGNREGTVVPSLHGMRSGNEYSFVVLFVLGADGLWRVWWF